MGLSAKFYFCQLVQSDWVLFIQDNLEFQDKTLNELLVEYAKNPRRIVGKYGKDAQSGSSLYQTFYHGYSSQDAERDVEVILSQFMVMERGMCSRFFEYSHLIWEDVVLSNGEGPLWNGEDIFMSLVANHVYDRDGGKNNYAMPWLDVREVSEEVEDYRYETSKFDLLGGQDRRCPFAPFPAGRRLARWPAMALRASAALGALLLALASAGESDDVDTQCLLSTRASAPSAELDTRPQHISIAQKYQKLGDEVAALKTKLGKYKASHASSASSTPCCAESKKELGNRLSELKKWAQELGTKDPKPLPSATPCVDEVQSAWDTALSDFDLKGKCRNADYTMQTIKKEKAAFGSECHGMGSAKVEALWAPLKYQCLPLCKDRGVEVGKLLAKQVCDGEKPFIDNYWMTGDAYPPLEGNYKSGTIVNDCHTDEQESCKKQFAADAVNCKDEAGNIGNAVVYCARLYDAINP